MDVGRIHSVEEARRLAARTLPRPVFDYVDGGADDEVTMRANVSAFREVTFRPRAGGAVGEPRTATTLLGVPLALPVVLAPAGLVRLMHPDGAAGVARAGAAAGTLSVLSTVAGSSPEEVAAACGGPLWFQLYSPGGRPQTAELVERAQRAGYAGLVVTVDTAALGNRERDVRHGLAQPLHLTVRTGVGLGAALARRPRYVATMALAQRRSRHAAPLAPGPAGGDPDAGRVVMSGSPFSWDDVRDVRGRWTGPLVVKGVLTPDDARLAVEAGADAVVVSNHGGRQLDGAPATLRALPPIVDAVGATATVLLDGGVRRGSDVVKALAAGAGAVLIGRAFLYGLAAAGRPGVERVVEVLRTELVRTMTLLGCASVDDLDRSWIDLPRQ